MLIDVFFSVLPNILNLKLGPFFIIECNKKEESNKNEK